VNCKLLLGWYTHCSFSLSLHHDMEPNLDIIGCIEQNRSIDSPQPMDLKSEEEQGQGDRPRANVGTRIGQGTVRGRGTRQSRGHCRGLALGHTPAKIHWRAPGAVHHARWMAKLLYSIKIYLFRDDNGFVTTPREKAQLERFVKFGHRSHGRYLTPYCEWERGFVVVGTPAASCR
jgi:hypothetical protein